ncbi:MAG: DUF1844 domain-containing protein [Syntrophobacteraceae bacterium]
MAEKEEDKGFVVKDRRRFSSEEAGEGKEEAKPESGASAVGGEEKQKSAEPGPEAGEQQRGPFPEVTLATFVFSLSSSALVHLGEIPEPETNRSWMDLPMAKQIIDTLGMLQEKTKGNLDPDEDRLLRSVLYDLRMRFISKSSGK